MKKSQQWRFFPEAETDKIVIDRAHTKEIPKKPKPKMVRAQTRWVFQGDQNRAKWGSVGVLEWGSVNESEGVRECQIELREAREAKEMRDYRIGVRL